MTKKQRYGFRHQQIRRVLARSVQAGLTFCARCGEPIVPGTPWDLGHDDYDPRFYSGPEHAKCNRATAGRIEKVSRVW